MSLDILCAVSSLMLSSSNIASSSLTSFLDEFLVNVFQPQLDETLTEFSAHIFIELDAFQVDPQWANVAKRPVFKVCSPSGSRVGEIFTGLGHHGIL